MVRVAQGKLQLGVILDTRASSLLVAVVVPSRIAPGTTVDKSQVKCVLCTQPLKNQQSGHNDQRLNKNLAREIADAQGLRTRVSLVSYA